MRTEHDLPGRAWDGGGVVVEKNERTRGGLMEENWGADQASLDTWEIYGL